MEENMLELKQNLNIHTAKSINKSVQTKYMYIASSNLYKCFQQKNPLLKW